MAFLCILGVSSNNFIIFQWPMNKYKTIIPKSYRESLEESIEKKLLDNSLNRRTIDNSTEEPLMSTNKSIIFIKLPKKNIQNINNFRSSLYEASIKRLKQQRSNHNKDLKIPSIAPRKKNFQEFEEQVLKQYNLEKSSSKKALPHVHTPSQKIQKEKSEFTIFLEEKSAEEEQQYNKSRELTLNVDKRHFFLEGDESVFGYQNLKEKYLHSKQSSLINRRKRDLMEKFQSRSSLAEQSCDDVALSPYQSKQIQQHMNRYKHRDLFKTKLTGFKTNIYPVDHSLRLRREEQPIEPEFNNFVKRKKLKSTALYLNRLETQQNGKQLKREMKEHEEGKGMECTPWQTESHPFD